MEAGKLQRRVALQAAAETTTETGEVARVWTTYATVWARIEPLAGRELVYAQQTTPDVTHRVTLRYRADVTVAHRLLYGTRVLHIRAARNLEEDDVELQLDCQETPA